MSVVAAWVDAFTGAIHAASDSAVACGDGAVTYEGGPKVWRQGDMVLGAIGELRTTQILRYHLAIPGRGNGPLEEWLVMEFVPAVREALWKQGALAVEDEEGIAYAMDAEILIGTEAGIYLVGTEFSVLKVSGWHWAIGDGAAYAQGALCALESFAGMDVEARLKAAVIVPSHYLPTCGGDVHFASTKPRKPR